MPTSVVFPTIVVNHGARVLRIRPATSADVASLERWDRDPDVISAASDDPGAETAFAGTYWLGEISAQSDAACCYIAELDGRSIGAMQVIDPHREETRHWGEIEPNLRAIDIWIGSASDRGKGYGASMMRGVIDACFASPEIEAIIIDPLASNRRAHRFYQRLGFKPLGRRTFYGDDCLVHRLDRADWRKGN